MNIREAKQEIINTVRAYLAKDDMGSYLIPRERQRPVLVMGPPGVGKTAVMQQIAEELGISLVSYTITHHTRQSAIGLPAISKKNYGGQEYSVTEYTMSEIVASIYDQIERSGISEGILFLDEINCVSETLAPTMLQFLQYKTFGAHRVPDGYIIVTAGNPPEYNRSVRDFDIVTLDRVRRLDVAEDFEVWKEYALQEGVHGSVLSYLGIRREHFYSIRTEPSGRKFVTARGWEDLSDSIKVYETLGLPVTREMTGSFLQDPEIAESFTGYYALYRKYSEVYRIPEILDGKAPEAALQLKNAPFDEKLSLLGLLTAALGQEFRDWAEELDVQRTVFELMKELRDGVQSGSIGSTEEWLSLQTEQRKKVFETELRARLIGRGQERRKRMVLRRLSGMMEALRSRTREDGRGAYAFLRTMFTSEETARKARAEETGRHLTNTFLFLDRVFGQGQEMVLFLTDLSAGRDSLRFVREQGNEEYYKYNRMLLLKDSREELRNEVMKLL